MKFKDYKFVTNQVFFELKTLKSMVNQLNELESLQDELLDQIEVVNKTSDEYLTKAFEQGQDSMEALLKWASSEDTGASSISLFKHMLGFEDNRNASPMDAGDRGRCIRLLNLMPEWWDRLDEMAEKPSTQSIVFNGGGLDVEEHGWKEQIPLIRKEGLK